MKTWIFVAFSILAILLIVYGTVVKSPLLGVAGFALAAAALIVFGVARTTGRPTTSRLGEEQFPLDERKEAERPWRNRPPVVVGRPKPVGPPAVWPLVLWTVIFLPIGLVSTYLRARRARALDRPERPYWQAMAITVACMVFLWLLVSV